MKHLWKPLVIGEKANRFVLIMGLVFFFRTNFAKIRWCSAVKRENYSKCPKQRAMVNRSIWPWDGIQGKRKALYIYSKKEAAVASTVKCEFIHTMRLEQSLWQTIQSCTQLQFLTGSTRNSRKNPEIAKPARKDNYKRRFHPKRAKVFLSVKPIYLRFTPKALKKVVW